MLGFLAEGIDLKGFAAADRIIGKASAMLFVVAGVGAAYAPVVSEQALATFARFGIECAFDSTTDIIMNSAGTGPCPMAQAVKDIDDPAEALAAIRQTVASLADQNARRQAS